VIQSKTRAGKTHSLTPSHPVVSDGEVQRTLLGKYNFSYQCPHCDKNIFSEEHEVEGLDRCPHCHGIFAFAPEVQNSLRSRQQKDQSKKEQKNLAKKERRDSKRLNAKEKKEENRRRNITKRQERDEVRRQRQIEREQQANEKQAARQQEVVDQPADNEISESNTTRNSFFSGIGGLLIIFGILFRIFCGIFVIQPIGAIPDGVTIIYWRQGIDVPYDMPFIASADGILEERMGGVSLLGRGAVLARVAEPIKEREIIRFGYSKWLYSWSTGGRKYGR